MKRNKKQTLVMPTVWVKTPDGMFEQCLVEIGINNKREVEIVSGLMEGDRVVVSGAYRLNSAWKVNRVAVRWRGWIGDCRYPFWTRR